MEPKTMQKILNNVKKECNLDFVYWNIGTCCMTCMELDDPYVSETIKNAESLLIVKHYTDGMNYDREFEEYKEFNMVWSLSHEQLDKVCESLERQGIKVLFKPTDSSRCITIQV